MCLLSATLLMLSASSNTTEVLLKSFLEALILCVPRKGSDQLFVTLYIYYLNKQLIWTPFEAHIVPLCHPWALLHLHNCWWSHIQSRLPVSLYCWLSNCKSSTIYLSSLSFTTSVEVSIYRSPLFLNWKFWYFHYIKQQIRPMGRQNLFVNPRIKQNGPMRGEDIFIMFCNSDQHACFFLAYSNPLVLLGLSHPLSVGRCLGAGDVLHGPYDSLHRHNSKCS